MNCAEELPLEPSQELQRLTVNLVILIQCTQFKRHQRRLRCKTQVNNSSVSIIGRKTLNIHGSSSLSAVSVQIG